jgi:hypothetical protein
MCSIHDLDNILLILICRIRCTDVSTMLLCHKILLFKITSLWYRQSNLQNTYKIRKNFLVQEF